MKLKPKYLFTLVLFAVVAYLLLFRLGSIEMQFWDESTNVAVVMESAKSPDWWNLKFYNDSFWEKPPLWYWLGILVTKLMAGCPINIDPLLALRLITTISAAGTIGAIWLFVRGKWGIIAANWTILSLVAIPALWQTNPAGVFSSHTWRSADVDSLQIFFITVASLLALHIRSGTKKNWLLFGIGLFTALAVMTKGVFGLLPLVLVVIELLRLKDKKQLIVFMSALLALIALLVLPWHIYMWQKFGGEFIQDYFVYHQLSRGVSSLESHNGPVWFHMVLQANPIYSGQLLVIAILFFLAKNRVKDSIFQTTSLVYTIILGAISVVQTKLSWYGMYLYTYGSLIFSYIVPSKLNLKLVLMTFLTLQLASSVVYVATPGNRINPIEFQALPPGSTLWVGSKQPDRTLYAWSLIKSDSYINFTDKIALQELTQGGNFSQIVIAKELYQKESLNLDLIAGDEDYLLLKLNSE